MQEPHHVLVVTYWSFQDALIQTYTLPYLKIMAGKLPPGSTIYLVTLDKAPLAQQELSQWNIVNVSLQYRPFGLKGMLMWAGALLGLVKLIRRKQVRTIHTWCTPAGMIGYILSVLTRRRLIIDSFEPHAEPMAEGNTWKRTGLAFRLLFYFEKRQLKRASEVICAVQGMIPYSQRTYGISKKRYFVKPACVDLGLFSWSNVKKPELVADLQLENTISCVYAGKFGGLYLEAETFAFFKAAYDHWGEAFRVLLLTNHSDSEIAAYSREAGLPSSVIIKRFVPHSEVADYIGAADFAICPMKPLPSRRYGTPIKNGEYWALGLPVVVTAGISDDSDIIAANGIGSVLTPLTPEGYRCSVLEIDRFLQSGTRAEHYARIRPIAERYRHFRIADAVYTQIYGTHES